jgi:hypothetical protein
MLFKVLKNDTIFLTLKEGDKVFYSSKEYGTLPCEVVGFTEKMVKLSVDGETTFNAHLNKITFQDDIRYQ